ncbi:kinesin-like protein KIF20B [Anas platyrhynchos]|uniref:kinesin-like protein KIF20B n=1 Tax=Anas platyrhynchos TaxID=8839 RepID=UPI003AF20FE5
MDPIWDEDKFFRPSYVTSAELPQRTGPRSSLESKGHIEVCLRVRPFTLLEKENESQDCFLVEDSTSIILKPPKNSLNRLSEKTAGQQIQKFTFSQVFGPETTQEEFFEGTMKQPVQDFLEGYDRLIFTYGVTNAGKTYTFLGTEDDIGVLPRTMDMLFKSIQGRLYPGMDLKPHRCRDYVKLTKDQVREETAIKNSLLRLTKEVEHQNTANSKAPVDSKELEEPLKGPEQSSTTVENYLKFSVWVSFFEIYNECFYDLLVPISNDKKRKTLRLAQDVKGCPYVKDLQWVQISDSREAFKLLKLGLKHQSIASTKLNTSSSRSHSIFTVKVLKIEDFETPRVIRVNELSLCDLAGSERCTKTRNEGDRLKESGNINTSLLILGKCINALKNCQQSKLQQHIPFRESKLTHFLQGFFSGRGKVYMIVNISQCASAYDETLNVLKFSAIAQKDKTVTSIKRKMAEESSNKVAESSQVKESEETVLEAGRKRSLGNEPTVEEEPPTKKGVVKDSWEDLSIERERTEHVNQNSYDKHMETLALKERVETLESQIAALEQQRRREENEKEEFSEQVTNLQLQLSHSEERATGLSEELQQYRTDYQQIVSELDKQKTINKEKEEKILQLKKEVEDAKQNIIDKVSQIKTMQSKVDKLCKSHLESHAMDLVDLKDSLDYEKEESETSQINSMYMQSQTTSIADPRWESSFHYSVESIWEECKSIIKASSQKSQQIKELVQEVENLKKGLEDSENCNNQLKVKLSEMTKQDSQSIKEKALMDQLKEQIQKKTQDFEKRAAEDHRVITQFEEEVTSYKVKIRELECLLEAFQKKEDSMTKLEEILKQKESIILNLEANTVALQEKCANSDQKIKELYSQEANLNEEVVQLTNSLEKMKLSLWEKEKYENERTQSIELLNKDPLDSSALVQSLKKDLQRKEEDYEDLKKKFSDAKKQIQQVQKEVLVMDTSILPHDQSFGQKLVRESSLLSDAKIPIPRKRATILWDRSVEDGIEDDNDEMEEHHNLEREEEEQRHDENQVLIGKEEYTALLSLIKDLKNKLNTEKKNKLVLELKVREEMAQEFSQYMAEWEINFIECLFHECERLEENSERRLEIFKEFVNDYTENPDEEEKFKDQSCSEQAGPLDKTVTSIKRKMAEESSNKVAESSQVKESEETVLEAGRKRSLGNEPTVEEEPPTKKGVVKDSWEDLSIERERTEHVNQNSYDKHMETLALKERVETLESQIAALEQQCRREENEKEEFSEQVTNLQLQLSHSEERATGLSEELQQYRTDYQQIVSELDKQKTINKEKEEKILQLKKEVEDAKQNIIDKVSQIKTMQSKVDKLCKSHLESHAMDLVDLKDSLDYEKEESETSQINSMYMQSQTTSIADPRWESSFHYSVESIWEECKSIIKASSQKSQQIKELVQEVENLKKGLEDSENCNNQLKVKLSEMTKQDSQSIKEKALMDQLKEQIQKKTQDFEKRAAEDHRVITQFEEEVTSYKVKIRELECLLEAFQKKEDSMTKLEEILKQKESIILNLEANTVALQEKCANSDQKIKELYSQEANLNEEVVQLTNSLEKMKHSLWEKEKYEKERTQSIELLNKDLLDSSALVQSLKKDLQRKEEDYEDLKEKFSDAKKQIQQAQKEVSTMRSEEKSLRNKVNELEKIKTQLSEELDIKQRAIQQFKREQLSNEKLEEVSRQYENTRKELSAKEKIIEDMRMTLEEQEQTQIEQEQVLEAKLEENSRLVSELEMWKQKYMQLNNQSNTEWQPKMTRNDDTNINGNEELIKLQKELKENEAKYQTDRKKWMEEKKGLIDQVKEAESHRNREMKKFAEDRERHIKQQAEIERLAAQLVEKDSDLSKWREERDKLVEALEVQLKTLASKTIQKDKEIAELKQSVLKDSGKDNETVIELRKQLADKEDFIKELKKCINHESLQFSPEVPLHEESQDTVDLPVNKEFMKKQSEINPITGDTVPIRHEVKENDSNSASSLSETEEHSETVLDSSEVSTENGRTSRFPKPEMEIQFTPLQPNKMEVKHQGSALPVTVKMLKTRSKRKSDKMDEDFVKSENKKNEKSMAFSSPSTSNKKTVSTTQTSRKEYSLRKQESTSNKRSARKKDGTLQRLGGFSQSSPTIIHSKAKKQMATISSPKSSPKSSEPESLKGNEIKPKRAKRKLYSTDISSPLDISASSIFIEQNEKESDHLIIKRRLRSKPAK